jgi:hypothetical protein
MEHLRGAKDWNAPASVGASHYREVRTDAATGRENCASSRTGCQDERRCIPHNVRSPLGIPWLAFDSSHHAIILDGRKTGNGPPARG